MTAPILTIEHEFMQRGNHAVLAAAGGVPLHESLDAATDILEAVVAGLRDLMSSPAVSNQATLVFFAAESALAIVYSAHAATERTAGGVA